MPAIVTPAEFVMFWHGCNYPWSTDGTTVFYGMDFGANVWGSHVGVSTRRAAVARDFASMASLGFVVARWFVFADGRSGIVYDDRGLPQGLDPHVFADLDAALEIAGGAGMRVVLVLLDHRWMYEGIPDTIADPATGLLLEARLPAGRARILQAHAGHDALMARVIEPIVRRYGRDGARSDLGSHILAYELMNEPDFVIEEWERDLSRHAVHPVRFELLADLVMSMSAAVHQHTSVLSTMGAARLHNLWAWDDDLLGLDFLQVHSYPDTVHTSRDADVFGMKAAALGVRRPVVLGEFPGNALEQHPPHASPPSTTLGEYLAFALEAGYLGAWPWSFSGTDAYGGLPEATLRAFARAHPHLVNPSALV